MNCVPVCPDNPAIVKDFTRCVSCGHCLAVCREEIGPAAKCALTGVSDFACVHCGQCTTVCPEHAIYARPDWVRVRDAVRDPEKIVVISTAPSVRVGLGDCFGEKKGAFVEGKMVAALKALGADHVLDVAFAADLTIMEEGTEFLRRLLSGKGTLPQFTSCCPAWVKYVETFHPARIPNLSSAKSPISMQGALVKTYFAQKMGLDPERIVTVAVAPCTAKKFEITREELCDAGAFHGIAGLRDNDYVLTTQELADWMHAEQLDLTRLAPADFDSIMGKSSGAGLIFGNTGGVMEAALRMVYASVTGQEPTELLLAYTPVRGMDEVKEATVSVGGKEVRVAVVYGTKAAEALIESGQIDTYHFVEVMTCPGGCISGAGQPRGPVIPVPNALRQARIHTLYEADRARPMRTALDNPEIGALYDAFLTHPLSERAEQLLHTAYHSRQVTRDT